MSIEDHEGNVRFGLMRHMRLFAQRHDVHVTSGVGTCACWRDAPGCHTVCIWCVPGRRIPPQSWCMRNPGLRLKEPGR